MALAVVPGFGMAVIMAYVSGSPFVLRDEYGLTAQQFSLAFAIGGTALVLGSQLNAALVRRVGPDAAAPVRRAGDDGAHRRARGTNVKRTREASAVAVAEPGRQNALTGTPTTPTRSGSLRHSATPSTTPSGAASATTKYVPCGTTA